MDETFSAHNTYLQQHFRGDVVVGAHDRIGLLLAVLAVPLQCALRGVFLQDFLHFGRVLGFQLSARAAQSPRQIGFSNVRITKFTAGSAAHLVDLLGH